MVSEVIFFYDTDIEKKKNMQNQMILKILQCVFSFHTVVTI